MFEDVAETIEQKYQLLMADPPWSYRDKVRSHGKGGAASHYKCIPYKELATFPMSEIAEVNSVLLLWTTFPQLPVACWIMNEWGFKYKTAAWIWVKLTKTGKMFMGLGHYSRANPEICLLGVRGKGLKVIRHDILNTQFHERLSHSEKPTMFYDLSVDLFGDVVMSLVRKIYELYKEEPIPIACIIIGLSILMAVIVMEIIVR
jgi:site-specific DNA-methyltransferase (adenine-specific)